MPEKCFLQLIRFASENVAKGKTQKEFLNTRFKHLFSSNAFTSTTIRFTFVHMCIYVILCNIKLWGGGNPFWWQTRWPPFQRKLFWLYRGSMLWSQCDFWQFSAKKLAFLFKTNVMIKSMHNLALFWVKDANVFAEFFGENIFKIITSV
jgi:hypothetical protein